MWLKRAGLALLGLYVCLVASIVHRHTAVAFGLDVPWATALTFVAAYSVARAVHPWVRSGDLFFALGWTIGFIVPNPITQPKVIGSILPNVSPGGSYLIAQDWLGITFMVGTLAALALAIFRSGRDV